MDLNFKRRRLLKTGAAGIFATAAGIALVTPSKKENLKEVAAKNSEQKALSNAIENEPAVRDNLHKVKHFNSVFRDDIYLSAEKQLVFQTTLNRILRVKKVIGYGNFNLVSFDDMLLYAHRFPKIGRFTQPELALIDEIFFYDANEYGFFGNKVIKDLTSTINKKETIKIAGSGHYLFQGEALAKFKQLKKDVGPNLILTSGVRSVVKQLQLFLAKLEASNGNLSLASRSLAPPGHSYHGIGDFDVGKKGFGKLNFTSRFSETDEYKRLIDLKYVDLRYTIDNQVGVRYEPWHIKVV